MAELSLNAKKREIGTKGTLNQMRKEGVVPCNFYLKGSDPISFSALEIDLKPLVFTSDTHLINLKIDGMEQLDCIIKDVQFDPVTDRVVHIDFLGVTYGQVLQIQVPVSLKGSPEGVKQGGLLQQYIYKLEVECLPKDIPNHFDIDVTPLDVGDTIHVRDLEFENVKILTTEDAAVVACTLTRIAVEEEETDDDEALDAEAVEPELIGKGKADEEEEEK